MYPCLLLKVLAEYNLQLCACSKRDSCVPVFLCALRGDTRPGYISRGGGRGEGVVGAVGEDGCREGGGHCKQSRSMCTARSV